MKKILVALLILIIICIGVGLYFAPVYFEQSLQRQAKEYLGRELQLGKVSLNPLNFSAQLEQLVLLDADGQPQLTSSLVDARTSFWGFWARTGQLHSLTLQEPTLYIEDNESGRLKFIQLLSDLSAAATKLPEKAQIESLILEQMSIVMLDRSHTPARVKSYPPFNLVTGSFDSARSGSFQFSREIVGQAGLMMEGVLNWQGAGASGQLFGADLDLKMFVPWSGVELNSQGKFSLKSDFRLTLNERALELDLEQCELALAAIEMRQQQLLGFSAEAMTVNGDLGLTFDADGLWLRDADIESADFALHGLGIDTSAAIQIPVRDARLVLGNLNLKGGSAVEFDLLMHTEPLGGMQLTGLYDSSKRSNRADFHLVGVPLSSLLTPSGGLLPRPLSREVLFADGSIQLHPSATEIEYEADLVNQRLVQGLKLAISESGPGQVASLVLAGQFQSGGKIGLLGFSSPVDPLRQGYLGLSLDELDAELASPITHDLAARTIASGELETELIFHLANGSLRGRQNLALENLVLEPSADPLLTAEPSLEFSAALLQDAENRIEISLAFNAVVDDDFQFTRLMRHTATRHLAQVAAEPVDTLAALLGTDHRNLETISFEPGQAGLSVTSMAQMEWIKTALQWRPGLSLSVSETYDPEADRYALAYQQVRLHVLLATAADAEFRSNSAPILFSDPKVQVVLDEFAGSRLGATAVNLIAESFDLSADTAEQPPPAHVQEAYYRALFDALVMQEQIGERALFSLARYRARAVIDQLAQEGIERNRLSRGGQQAVKTSLVRGVPVSLSLGYFDEPLALDEQSSEQDAGDPIIESNKQ